MKIGGFGKIADYKKIKEAGFQYEELDLPEIEALSEAEYEAFKKIKEEEGMPTPVGSRILPVAEALIFLDDFDQEKWREYLEHSCKRAAGLGIDKIIFGNGKARAFQKEEDAGKVAVFWDFMRMLAEICQKNGQELIIEPLGPKYSNFMNTVAEVVDNIKKIGAENIYTMVDLRHMVWSRETYQDILDYAPYIHHIHIDYPLDYPSRKFPMVEDDFNYGVYLNALRQAGIDKLMTVEADAPEDWELSYKKIDGVMKAYR